jgi:hypothetical protein
LSTPRIAFLGVCERSAIVRDGHALFWKQNLLGLKSVVISPLFPMSTKGIQIAIAIYDPAQLPKANLRFKRMGSSEEFSIGMELGGGAAEGTLEIPGQPLPVVVPKDEVGAVVSVGTASWATFLMNLPAGATITEPGRYEVFAETEGDAAMPVGDLLFLYQPAEPLTPERKQAIRALPGRPEFVEVRYACSQCQDEIRIYAALDRDAELEAGGCRWYVDVPDTFVCKCGKMRVPLIYIRESLHFPLERTGSVEGQFDFPRLFDQSTVRSTASQLAAVVGASTVEEQIQQFIAANPIVFHPFSPHKIFVKAPILSKYKTDFAIYDEFKRLILIEIERADLRLMKQDGGMGAELQHAFDQVRDWLHDVEQHRHAVLDGLGLASADVTKVRGVVIAGRDADYPAHDLNRLKWVNHDRVEFFTYDDLIAALGSLARGLETG